MALLQADKIGIALGDKQVLTEASLVIEEKERVGMVGRNGSGKSTFLNCLTGELLPDSGTVSVQNGVSLGYLEQIPDHRDGATAWDVIMTGFGKILRQRRQLRELEEQLAAGGPDTDQLLEQYAHVSQAYELANGYVCEAVARRILLGLGFVEEQFKQPWASFSGGEKTRLNLGCLLAMEPRLLLLDEPTNNLDVDSVEWLEGYLSTYPGAILVVSHDRMFLDRVANRIVELRDGRLKSYPGNYSTYLQLKQEEGLAHQRAYEKQQDYVRKTEAYILRFKAGIKAKQARGRQRQLKRLKKIERMAPKKAISLGQIKMDQDSATEVVLLDNVSKSVAGRQLFDQVNFKISKGARLALVGPNGCGKTTLLKIIMGEEAADTGQVRLGNRVNIAYFSQHCAELDPEATLLEEIMRDSDLKVQAARQYLGRMLFTGDDVFKKVGELSGGEQVQLALLKVMLSGANFLILDEPTNHLDIPSSEAVENVLATFPGTILVVSHDRYFLKNLVNGVLAIENGKLVHYQGDYAYYQEKSREKKKRQEEEKQRPVNHMDDNKAARTAEREKQKIIAKRQAELQDLEDTIENLEQQKGELELSLANPITYQDSNEAKRCAQEFQEVERLLHEAYSRWAQLAEAVEGC